MSEFGDWIRAARVNLEVARAKGEFPRVERSVWMKDEDPLARVLDEQERLLREGEIVWSELVQANDELLHRGWMDFPAFVVHGSGTALDDEPEPLREVAERLFALRGGGGANAEERSLGALLDDEMDRANWRRVPQSISPGSECCGSAVLVVRRWLPGTTFAGLPLPLLVHPSRTGQVLPLPQQYWPEALRARWMAGLPEPPSEKEELRVGGLGFLFPVVLIGSLVFLPALVDRVGLLVGQQASARNRWTLTLLLPGIALGLVAWLRKKLRRSPAERTVYQVIKGHEIKLLSDDELGLSLGAWAGLIVIAGTLLKFVLPK
jgi:hypothetical protein